MLTLLSDKIQTQIPDTSMVAKYNKGVTSMYWEGPSGKQYMINSVKFYDKVSGTIITSTTSNRLLGHNNFTKYEGFTLDTEIKTKRTIDLKSDNPFIIPLKEKDVINKTRADLYIPSNMVKFEDVSDFSRKEEEWKTIILKRKQITLNIVYPDGLVGTTDGIFEYDIKTEYDKDLAITSMVEQFNEFIGKVNDELSESETSSANFYFQMMLEQLEKRFK